MKRLFLLNFCRITSACKTLQFLKTLLIAIIIMSAVNEPVVAQVGKPFTQRTSIYSPDKKIYNIRGDFQLIGNTNMRAGSGTNNGNTTMYYVDIDNNSTTVNSSSAELTLSNENGANPQCSNIIFAGLYWTGRAHDGNSPDVFELPGTNLTNGYSYNGYTVTITQQASGMVWVTTNTTYTFTPTGGGDVIKFVYSNWTDVITQRSDLTMQIGNGDKTFITGYSESNVSSNPVLTLRTPILLDAGGANMPFYLTGFRKNRNGSSVNGAYAIVAKQLNKRQVKFKHVSATNYTMIIAKPNDIYYPNGSTVGGSANYGGYMYAGYAEVTDYVKQYGLGNYFVADIALREGDGGGTGFYGGWAMVVVYENSKMTWRDVTIYDGHAYVVGSATINHQLPVSGFNTAQSGPIEMKLGLIAGEGDSDITGDYFHIQPHNSSGWNNLSHSGNAVNNFFNSSIETGGNARNPNLTNNFGMDIAMFKINNQNNSIITNGQTSTTFRYGSTQDTYIIPFIAMAVDAYVPSIEGYNKVTKVNGSEYIGGSVLPGDVLEIEMEVRNRGSEPINNLEYVLPIPYTTNYVSSSLSAIYEPGLTGTVMFDPSRDATGSIVWNINHVPLPSNGDQVMAKLTYRLKVTTDCFILSNPRCPPSVTNEGYVTGTGSISDIFFTNDRFVIGYKPAPCDNEPIYGYLSTEIDRTAYVNANCNGGAGYDNRTFYYCDLSSPTVPYDVIANNFPAGTKFYDDIEFLVNPETGLPTDIVAPTDTSNVFTSATGFPKSYSGPYYAIPPGLANSCYWIFDIEYSVMPLLSVTNATMCYGDTIDLEDYVTVSGLSIGQTSTIIAYNNSDGTEIISQLVSPGASRSYWVRAKLDNSSCYSDLKKIDVTLTGSTASMIAVPGATICKGESVALTAMSSEVTDPTFKWYSSQTSTTVLYTGKTFTTPNLTGTTTYYVSVENISTCENLPGDRKAVTVTVNPYSSPTMIIVTK